MLLSGTGMCSCLGYSVAHTFTVRNLRIVLNKDTTNAAFVDKLVFQRFWEKFHQLICVADYS